MGKLVSMDMVSLTLRMIVIGDFYAVSSGHGGRWLLGGAAAMFALNFIIGGFVLVWRLLVAMWYVSLTIYRTIVGY